LVVDDLSTGEKMMSKTVRWIAFLPLAVLVSLLAGWATNWLSTSLGGADWFVWMLSGAASSTVFFSTSFRVAPSESSQVKWVSVATVGVLGMISAVGELIAGGQPTHAFAGATMVGYAVYYARRPAGSIMTGALAGPAE
jgi:Na+-translocating ferredoxin:NAD+ oxidoreductase RnfD subunit